MLEANCDRSVIEAEKNAAEREEGWSSDGSDGGGPVAPVSPDVKSANTSRATPSRPYNNKAQPPRQPSNFSHRGNGNAGQSWRSPNNNNPAQSPNSSSNDQAVDSWLNGPQNNWANLPSKVQDLNTTMNKLDIVDKKPAARKPYPHEMNRRVDAPIVLEPSGKSLAREETPGLDGWGQPISGPPETPDPR